VRRGTADEVSPSHPFFAYTYAMPAKVLVVEDNEMNMQLFEYLLEEGGYQILKATSGEDALRVVAEKMPDLILMDIHLPGMDGLSVVRELKNDAKMQRIPILALTAHAMRGDKDRFLQAGCDGYISKPIDVKTFIPSIQKFLSAE
jgi:CheY-like chemotaxis protein